jgi:uncharacterized membrane protein YedE/YeeE
MIELLSRPWPWWVAGPMIGLVVAALLVIGNKPFGVSSNFRHICAAIAPRALDYFRYDWRHRGGWNLAFVIGMVVGGWVGGRLLASPAVAIAPDVKAALASLGVMDFSGLAPREVFNWSALLTPRGLVCIVGGGFLVGFGTAYAGGCTSGHAITGLASLEWRSLVAVIGFFGGGLVATYAILPLLF